MRNSILLFIPIVLCMLGCNNNASKLDNATINIDDLFQNKIEMKASDLYEEVDYLFLNQGEEFVSIPAASYMKVYDDYLLYSDMRNRKLYLFNREGNLVNNFDYHGKGPGEFIEFLNFGLIESEGLVYLFDNFKYIVHYYTIEGNWVESFKLETNVLEINVEPDLRILAINDQTCEDEYDMAALILLDKNGQVEKSLYTDYHTRLQRTPYQKYTWLTEVEDKRVFRFLNDDDTFYQIDSDYNVSPFLTFDGVNTIEVTYPIDQEQEQKRRSETINVYGMKQIGSELFIGIRHKGQFRNVIYNMKSGGTSYFDTISDDLIGIRSFNIGYGQHGPYTSKHYNVPYAKTNDTYIFDKEDVMHLDLQKEVKSIISKADDEVDCLNFFFKFK